MKLQYDAFTSQNCRIDDHKNCARTWTGLEIEVVCICLCHSKKRGLVDPTTKQSRLDAASGAEQEADTE